MEPVKQVLARIDCEVAITAAAPDVRRDLPASERDLVSDDDDEGEGGEMESIPDETDYAGNLHDEFETALAMQEQQVEIDVDLGLHEYEPVIVDVEEAPLRGEITTSPPNQLDNLRPPSSPPSPSPNHLLLTPTPLIPSSQASQNRHPKKGARATFPDALRPSVVSNRSSIAAVPSNRLTQFYPPPSPPPPSHKRLPLVPTPLTPPSKASQKQHPNEDTRVTIASALRPSVVSDTRFRPPAAPPEPSRVSGRFHLMGEVITEFRSPTRWMQGAMVQAFGEVCCRATYSRPERARRVDILPSEFLTMLERSNSGIENDRLEFELHIQRCLQPERCGMWLIPICHNSHWWLIKVDWIHESALILDSLSTRGRDAKEVLIFAQKIVAKIHEVLKRPYVLWSSFLLDPVSPDVSRVSPSLNDR